MIGANGARKRTDENDGNGNENHRDRKPTTRVNIVQSFNGDANCNPGKKDKKINTNIASAGLLVVFVSMKRTSAAVTAKRIK